MLVYFTIPPSNRFFCALFLGEGLYCTNFGLYCTKFEVKEERKEAEGAAGAKEEEEEAAGAKEEEEEGEGE